MSLLCAFLLLLAAPTPTVLESVVPQESGAGALIPVSHPDLSAAERLIREQLEKERSKLKAKTENQEVPDSARADAFGRMGKLYHA